MAFTRKIVKNGHIYLYEDETVLLREKRVHGEIRGVLLPSPDNKEG